MNFKQSYPDSIKSLKEVLYEPRQVSTVTLTMSFPAVILPTHTQHDDNPQRSLSALFSDMQLCLVLHEYSPSSHNILRGHSREDVVTRLDTIPSMHLMLSLSLSGQRYI